MTHRARQAGPVGRARPLNDGRQPRWSGEMISPAKEQIKEDYHE